VRLLADENIPLASVPRVLLTFDKDFGALALKHGLPAPAGIVLLRLTPVTPQEPATVLLDLLAESGLTLPGNFTVVDREHVRQRPLQHDTGGG